MNDFIVLSHGIARFDALWNPLAKLARRLSSAPLDQLFDSLHYFRNIKTSLEDHGFTVFHTDVPFAASLEERAKSLAEQLRGIQFDTGEKLHVIGHSMGGLDARYAIARLGCGDVVSKLSTIGTPHLGTSFADWGLANRGDRIVRAIHPFMSMEGLLNLTRADRRKFNAEHEAAEADNLVAYHTYAGFEELDRVFLPLRGPWQIINEAEGPNDGLVPVLSQLWTNWLNNSNGGRKPVWQHNIPFPVDHFNECGWWDVSEPEKRSAFEARLKDLYLEIART